MTRHLRALDGEIGALLERMPDNARVFLVGTNGVRIGENRPTRADTPPRARAGDAVFEEQVRVPLIAAGPRFGTGRVAGVVSTTDLAPSILHLAGADPLEDADGERLPRVAGRHVQGERDILLEAVRYGSEQQAIRRGRWKLWRQADGELIVYDLSADPLEARPVLHTDPHASLVIRDLKPQLPAIGAAQAGQAPVHAGLWRLLDRFGD